MDFHLYTSHPRQISTIRKTLLSFIPLFLLSAILPVTLVLIKNPVTDKFDSQAAQNDLTIWFTPSTTITSIDKPVELTLHAHFESENLLPGVSLQVKTKESASIKNPGINFVKPFNGEIELGKVTVVPIKKGELNIYVEESSVVSQTYNGVFHLLPSEAKIIVE